MKGILAVVCCAILYVHQDGECCSGVFLLAGDGDEASSKWPKCLDSVGCGMGLRATHCLAGETCYYNRAIGGLKVIGPVIRPFFFLGGGVGTEDSDLDYTSY